jgi:hypothetical protein
MASVDDWLALLDGRVSTDDARVTISEALAQLEKIVADDPDATNRILAILGRRLGSKITDTTWVETQTALTRYVGNDLPFLLTWAAQTDVSSGRLDEITSMGTPRAMSALRAVLGQYGSELGYAYELSGQIDNDWRIITQNVYYDSLAQRYLFRVRIEKYGGEKVLLEFIPNSMLSFVRILMTSIQQVSSADVFDTALQSLVRQTIDDFTKFISPPAGAAEPTPEESAAASVTAPADAAPSATVSS